METHTAIFKGIVREIKWEYYVPRGYNYTSYPENDYEHEVLENQHRGFRKIARANELETFWMEEIDNPIFEIGEKVWISDLGILVKITDKYRTTNGQVIYETNHVTGDVESENIEQTRLLAVGKWLIEEFGFNKTFEEIKELYETKPEEVSEPELVVEPEVYSVEVEEKPKEKTWFGWLDFFKKD